MIVGSPARRALATASSPTVLDQEAAMTRQHTPGSAPDLTAKDWGLILTALGAYQHQEVYRALHEKVSPVAKAAGVVASPATRTVWNARNRPHLAR